MRSGGTAAFLRGKTSALPKTLYVEGVEASEALQDVQLKLSYTVAGSTFEDIVNVTVVEGGVDIDGVSDEGELSRGGLVGQRRDGNNAPRKKVSLRVVPSGW